MELSDWICTGVCMFICVLHFVVGLINSKLTSKKIEKICERCFQPVFEGEEHKCPDFLTSPQYLKLRSFLLPIVGSDKYYSMSDEEIKLLSEFVNSLKE